MDVRTILYIAEKVCTYECMHEITLVCYLVAMKKKRS